MRSLRLSVGLLTVIPVGRVDPDAGAARNAMLLAPLVGLLAGAPGALLLVVIDGPPLVAAALAVASLALMTGALHWDGLADTADGLAVPPGQAARLDVMRRSDLGPTGALAIGTTLLLQVGALASLADRSDRLGAWLLTVAISRAALPLACVRGTSAARPAGRGALVIGTVPATMALAPAAVILAAGMLSLPSAVRAAAAVLAAIAAGWLVRAVAIRRIGGLTGDVLGAVVEISATACLIAMCVEW